MGRALSRLITFATVAALGAPAAAESATILRDVRVGAHPGYDRVVIELDGPADIAWERGPEPGAESFYLSADPIRTRTIKTGLARVGDISVAPMRGGTRVYLEPRARRVRAYLLAKPPRLVIDIAPPGDAAFRPPKGVQALAPATAVAAKVEPEPAPSPSPEPPPRPEPEVKPEPERAATHEPSPAETKPAPAPEVAPAPPQAETAPPPPPETPAPEAAPPEAAPAPTPAPEPPPQAEAPTPAPEPPPQAEAPTPAPEPPPQAEAPPPAPEPRTAPEPEPAPSTPGSEAFSPDHEPFPWTLLLAVLLGGGALGAIALAVRARGARASARSGAMPPEHVGVAGSDDFTDADVRLTADATSWLEQRLDEEVRARVALEERLAQAGEELKVLRDRLYRVERKREDEFE